MVSKLDQTIQDTIQVHLTIHGPQTVPNTRQYILNLVQGSRVEDINAAIVDLICANKLTTDNVGKLKVV